MRPTVQSLSRLVAFFRSRKVALVVLAAVVAVGVFGIGHPAHAVITELVLLAAGKLLELYLSLVSQLVMFAVNLLIEVAGYNNFINATAVKEGWVIIRDIANMVIVVVLLVIAFGTMLGKEEYHWKQLLPRLIITAIFINFSKTIIGIMIDAGQVVMLTFVNGFAAAAGGNFMNALRLTDTINLIQKQGGVSIASIEVENFMAYLLGAITVTIALIVITVFLIILLFRVIALWILIIMAPLAWVLGTFPKGQEYYAEWWKRLTNQIIVGPILAFFLWLSLVVAGSGASYNEISAGNPLAGQSAQKQEFGKIHACNSKICEWENLAGYFIAIALLMAGLQFTQELGVAGAGVASGIADKMKGGALALAKFTALTAPRVGLSWTERKAAKMGATFGFRLNPVLMWQGFKEGLEDAKKRDESQAASKTLQRVKKGGLQGALASALGQSRDFTNEYLNGFLFNKGIQRIIKGKPKNVDEEAAKEQAAKEEEEKALEEASRMTTDERAAKIKTLQNFKKEAEAKTNATELDLGDDATRAEVGRYAASEDKKVTQLRKEMKLLKDQGDEAGAQEKTDEANALAGSLKIVKQAIDAKGKLDLSSVPEFGKRWKESWKGESDRNDKELEVLTMSDTIREEAINDLDKDIVRDKGNLEKKELDAGNREDAFILTDHRDELNRKIKTLEQNKQFVEAGELEKERDKIVKALRTNKKIELTPELTLTNEWQKKWKEAVVEAQRELNNLKAGKAIAPEKRAEALARAEDAKKRGEEARDKKEEYAAWMPQGFYARQEERAHLAEEAKKVETDNPEELRAFARAAAVEDNDIKLVAVSRQAAKVGHLNEILDAFRHKEGPRKGMTYRQDHIGLSEFVNDVLIHELGLGRQTAYGYQQDLSQIAKNMGHWNFAEGMAYDGGRFRQRGFTHNGKRKDDDRTLMDTSREHQKNVYIEKEKMGIDKMLNFNRLSWGPEDRSNPTQKWGLDLSSLALMLKGWKAMGFKLNRGQVNDNLLRYIVNNREGGSGLLERMVSALEVLKPSLRTERDPPGNTMRQLFVNRIPEATPPQPDVDDYFREIEGDILKLL